MYDRSQSVFHWNSEWACATEISQTSGENHPVEKWHLFWDGLSLKRFDSEAKLKVYILRFVYSIDPQYAIPSMLLYEAGLRYRQSIWIDEWFARNQGHACENNIISFGSEVGQQPWLPSEYNLSFKNQRPRKGKLGQLQPVNSGFLRLEKNEKTRKSQLVLVRAPDVNLKSASGKKSVTLAHSRKPGLPSYDRVLQRRIPGPGFVKINSNWKDVSWESRPGRALSPQPKRMPTDRECFTFLTAEIGFPRPKEKEKS